MYEFGVFIKAAYPDRQVNVLPSPKFHSSVQFTNLEEEFPVDGETRTEAGFISEFNNIQDLVFKDFSWFLRQLQMIKDASK